jgi:hypothetical protein
MWLAMPALVTGSLRRRRHRRRSADRSTSTAPRRRVLVGR